MVKNMQQRIIYSKRPNLKFLGRGSGGKPFFQKGFPPAQAMQKAPTDFFFTMSLIQWYKNMFLLHD